MIREMDFKLPERNLLTREINGNKELLVSYSQIDMFDQCPMKWYKSYVEGDRSTEKQEATSYGSVIHRTLEHFFLNGRIPDGDELSRVMERFSEEEDIPFVSAESMMEATRDAAAMIAWLVDLFKVKWNDEPYRAWKDLSPIEKVIRGSSVIGVEEGFKLPYRLPVPVTLDGKTHDRVIISGSVDWIGRFTAGGKSVIYTIDWKSGRRIFDKKKLEHNLQHPIYSFHVLRKYGELPAMCSYFFTRKLVSQEVKVDKERMMASINELNGILSRMYGFGDKSVTRYLSYNLDEDTGKCRYKYREMEDPIPANMEPKPSPLCAWCDFSKGKKGTCPYSSDWDESMRSNKS